VPVAQGFQERLLCLGRSTDVDARPTVGLTALVHTIHRRSKGAYGSPSIRAELTDDHGQLFLYR
jgi:hypothetical protein